MKEEKKEVLPQLVKKSSTFKMTVPAKVEEKIRYLIRKFPNTEWSGVLFFTHTGSFEENNLEITCEDIFPMDLGTSGWTEFQMTEDVAAYMAQDIELFNCETGLIHSHHNIGAYFSGQDVHTLQSEGNDTNCFVSLIVDTKGTYVAAITRKVQSKIEVVTKSLGTSYEFFGEGEITTGENPMSESTRIVDREVIEYFMLDVEREIVDNPLDYLDARFKEIEESKKAKTAEKKDYTKWDLAWPKEESKTEEKKELTIFDAKTMKEMEKEWSPDSFDINILVDYLLTCSLIINTKGDIEQWVVTNLQKRYDEVFSSMEEFEQWADAFVEFLINHYVDANCSIDECEDWDLVISKVAEAMIEKISPYTYINYVAEYKRVLKHYII